MDKKEQWPTRSKFYSKYFGNYLERGLESAVNKNCPGLVVMGGDSCSNGHEFEYIHWIVDVHFLHIFVVKNVCVFEKLKLNEKEAGVGPFKKEFCNNQIQSQSSFSSVLQIEIVSNLLNNNKANNIIQAIERIQWIRHK